MYLTITTIARVRESYCIPTRYCPNNLGQHPLVPGTTRVLEYSTDVQVSARALINLRFQYLLKCALTVSAHVLRFQYLLTYLVRTNLYSKIGTKLVRTK